MSNQFDSRQALGENRNLSNQNRPINQTSGQMGKTTLGGMGVVGGRPQDESLEKGVVRDDIAGASHHGAPTDKLGGSFQSGTEGIPQSHTQEHSNKGAISTQANQTSTQMLSTSLGGMGVIGGRQDESLEANVKRDDIAGASKHGAPTNNLGGNSLGTSNFIGGPEKIGGTQLTEFDLQNFNQSHQSSNKNDFSSSHLDQDRGGFNNDGHPLKPTERWAPTNQDFGGDLSSMDNKRDQNISPHGLAASDRNNGDTSGQILRDVDERKNLTNEGWKK